MHFFERCDAFIINKYILMDKCNYSPRTLLSGTKLFNYQDSKQGISGPLKCSLLI